MTDAEINLAIAKIEYADDHLIGPYEGDPEKIWTPDYCNNWQDIGPIIEREKIDLTATDYGWEANSYFYENKTEAETPTKAAALCYLKMRESE